MGLLLLGFFLGALVIALCIFGRVPPPLVPPSLATKYCSLYHQTTSNTTSAQLPPLLAPPAPPQVTTHRLLYHHQVSMDAARLLINAYFVVTLL